MQGISYKTFIRNLKSDNLSLILCSIIFIILLIIYIEWDFYIKNPIQKLKDMKTNSGIVEYVSIGRISSLGLKNEDFRVTLPYGIEHKILNKNIQIWFQEYENFLLGKDKYIIQIKMGDWLLIENYNKFYLNRLQDEKNAYKYMIFNSIMIILILSIIVYRNLELQKRYSRVN